MNDIYDNLWNVSFQNTLDPLRTLTVLQIVCHCLYPNTTKTLWNSKKFSQQLGGATRLRHIWHRIIWVGTPGMRIFRKFPDFRKYWAHSVDFQDVLRYVCPFLHIFRKCCKCHSHAWHSISSGWVVRVLDYHLRNPGLSPRPTCDTIFRLIPSHLSPFPPCTL